VFIEGEPVSVSSQSETVTDISGEVTESAYRYHTLSVDSAGELVVDTSPTGEFDPETPAEEPITQVAEPQYPAGNCYIGFAFQVEDRIERVYDGRYVIGELPNSIITQGEGSGLTAEFVDPQGEGSGLDADTVRQRVPFAQATNGEGFDQYSDTATNENTTNVFNVSGSGVILGGHVISETTRATVTLFIDDDDGTDLSLVDASTSIFTTLPTHSFNSSARLEITSGGSGQRIGGHATIRQD